MNVVGVDVSLESVCPGPLPRAFHWCLAALSVDNFLLSQRLLFPLCRPVLYVDPLTAFTCQTEVVIDRLSTVPTSLAKRAGRHGERNYGNLAVVTRRPGATGPRSAAPSFELDMFGAELDVVGQLHAYR